MNKKINVLISTYNGEKYIKEQLDSILAQTYPAAHIIIRDDGSSDHTVSVIREYAENTPVNNMTLIRGKNVGFGKSFLRLLQMAEDGDYWAFCDQDDVWMPEKLQVAMEWYEKNDKDIPILFHSAFQNTDENLKPAELYLPPRHRYDFVRSITDVVHMGFSEVINVPMRDHMLKGSIRKLNSHDHWAELIAMAFGEAYSDERVCSLHRRLDHSVSGMNMGARIKWLKKSFRGENEITPQAREFYRVFGEQLSVRNRRILSWFVYKKYDFRKSVCKAFYPARWRPVLSSEAVLRLLMLCGKI